MNIVRGWTRRKKEEEEKEGKEKKPRVQGSCVVEPLGDLCGRPGQFHCGHPTFVVSFLCGERSSLPKKFTHMYIYALLQVWRELWFARPERNRYAHAGVNMGALGVTESTRSPKVAPILSRMWSQGWHGESEKVKVKKVKVKK